MTTSFSRARRSLRTAALRLGATGLVVASVALPVDASAATSTKLFTAGVTPDTTAAGISQQAFTFVLGNCGSGISGCAKSSQQTLGSANISLDPSFGNVSASVSTAGWQIVQPVTGGLIQLRSSATRVALAPGQSISVSVVADTPSATGAYPWNTVVKQSNDFSGTGNEFTLSGTAPRVLVGFPDHLVFTTPPSTVQVTPLGGPASYICPAPSVQVVAADGSAVTAGTASVTLLADTSFGDPGLAGTTVAAAVGGLATFGSSACTSGLSAQNLGVGYRLRATASWTLGSYQAALSTAQSSSAFDVIQVLTICPANTTCTAAVNGRHTGASVFASSAPTTDPLELALGVDPIPASTTCLPVNQPTGLEVVRVVVDNRDKSVALTFDKYLVQQIPDNGTPRFPVCFAAPWGGWVTASGGSAILNATTNEFEGLLPNCGASGLAGGNPCVTSRGKSAASEVVGVSIPFLAGRADPKLW